MQPASFMSMAMSVGFRVGRATWHQADIDSVFPWLHCRQLAVVMAGQHGKQAAGSGKLDFVVVVEVANRSKVEMALSLFLTIAPESAGQSPPRQQRNVSGWPIVCQQGRLCFVSSRDRRPGSAVECVTGCGRAAPILLDSRWPGGSGWSEFSSRRLYSRCAAIVVASSRPRLAFRIVDSSEPPPLSYGSHAMSGNSPILHDAPITNP